jgi:hypothetical protein
MTYALQVHYLLGRRTIYFVIRENL